MENRTRILFYLTFVIITLIIAVCTVKKVYDNHVEAEYTVLEKKISESARNCYLDKICEGESTTFGFLVKSGYLTSMVNNITKEYIQDDLIITCKDYNCSVKLR